MAVHIIPVTDSREHQTSIDCPCEPDVEFFHHKTGEMLDQAVAKHQPADGNLGNRPGGWKTVDDDGDPEYGIA